MPGRAQVVENSQALSGWYGILGQNRAEELPIPGYELSEKRPRARRLVGRNARFVAEIQALYTRLSALFAPRRIQQKPLDPSITSHFRFSPVMAVTKLN